MFKVLKQAKPLLTKQQYRTLKGQLIAGDVEGVKKGLKKLIERKLNATGGKYETTKQKA